jgi:hypothetical protein
MSIETRSKRIRSSRKEPESDFEEIIYGSDFEEDVQKKPKTKPKKFYSDESFFDSQAEPEPENSPPVNASRKFPGFFNNSGNSKEEEKKELKKAYRKFYNIKVNRSQKIKKDSQVGAAAHKFVRK